MKALCVDSDHLINGPIELLKVGKTYDIIKIVGSDLTGEELYYVYCETGELKFFDPKRFILLRDLNLNKLDI
jgi:hypothetical protein